MGRRRAVMLLIVTDDGDLLLHHRDDKPWIAHPGTWAGFAGSIEDGETVEEALAREVSEETGLAVDGPVFLTEAIDEEGDGALVTVFYTVGGIGAGDIDLHEGAGIGVYAVEDLAGLDIPPFVRRVIEDRLLPALQVSPGR